MSDAKRPPGRPKGSQNKIGVSVRTMILNALDAVGGETYLAEQAQKNPGSFMTLVGRVLPMQVTGEDGGPVQITSIKRVIVRPKTDES